MRGAGRYPTSMPILPGIAGVSRHQREQRRAPSAAESCANVCAPLLSQASIIE